MGRVAYGIRGDIGALFLGLIFVLGLVPAPATQQGSTTHYETIVEPYKDADAYAIYAILLQGNRCCSLVIQSETLSWPSANSDNLGIKGGHRFHKIWGAALNDYAKLYRNPRALSRTIPMEVPYELVPEEKINAIFRTDPSWKMFYDLYPASGGFFSVSAVGFDTHRTHAIVSLDKNCGPLCGSGRAHFFEKKNGKWQEVSVKAEVEEWVS